MSLSANLFHSIDEVLHGVKVRDPYRWLEDPGLPETKQWIEEQRTRCESYFAGCHARDTLRKRVESLLNFAVVDQTTKVGGKYFYRRRNKDQEQACIYVRDGDSGIETLLVDPSSQGPFTSVGIYCISDDASLLAFEEKRGGEDTKEIRIVDTTSGRVHLQGVRRGYGRGFAFASANAGFYYCQEFQPASEDHVIRFHSFLSSTADRVVLKRPRVSGSRLVLTADGVHLGAIWIHRDGAEPACDFHVALRERDSDWWPVFVNKALPCSPILHSGRIFVLSYEGAPNGRLMELAKDGLEIRAVISKSESLPRQIVIAGDRFFVSYRSGGVPSIRSWTLDGHDAGELDIPVDGTIQILPQLAPLGESLFYTHESFFQPLRIIEYVPGIQGSTPFSHPVRSLDPKLFEIRTLSFAQKDGLTIPITLVARKGGFDTPMAPVIMTTYGGFGVSITPQFSVFATTMMELGAVFAMPHIRGGGEFGRPWHEAGRARKRQVTIDDFISAAEWLCAEGITCPGKLAIFGGSNAGLLVGAAMTQRPELFRAVLCIAPLLDMVRYERFDQAARWQSEYGSVDSAEDFYALHAYSPYHHVRRNVDYPATLFVTGDRDDRCNPAHVRKMAARIQGRTVQQKPILVDYSAERGHSPSLPLSVRMDALALRLAFLCKELGIEVPQQEVSYEEADR